MADWIKKAALEIWGNQPLTVVELSEVIARNVPQPQLLVPQGSAPDLLTEIKRLQIPDAHTSYTEGWNNSLTEVLEIIKRLARDVPQSKPDGWISVKDRMPGFSDVVIVVIDGIVQDVPAALSADDRWEWMNEGDSAPKEAVSHWQPFPKFDVPLDQPKEKV